jgi:hypothetical protein
MPGLPAVLRRARPRQAVHRNRGIHTVTSPNSVATRCRPPSPSPGIARYWSAIGAKSVGVAARASSRYVAARPQAGNRLVIAPLDASDTGQAG